MNEEGKELTIQKLAFVNGLLAWNRQSNGRKMPWKGEKDPYKIWLSEIILQQTRVAQGLAYYERFIAAFPTVQQLAAAPDDQVFKLWEGLGYYTRCRNLIDTAKFISHELDGIFPQDHPSILALKGVGSYTAAAIASFAYNLPYAVLDGNVFRVLSRVFDIDLPVDQPEGKQYFSGLAQDLLPPGQSAQYNQALMDFGATVCKPMPDCAQCFFRSHCPAFTNHRQLLLPVKSKRLTIKTRWFHYYVLQYRDQVAVWKRESRDIWQNLYEPLLLEGAEQLDKAALLAQLQKSYGITRYELISAAAQTSQRLTHQMIHFSFIHLLLPWQPSLEGALWISREDLHRFPFPKTILGFLTANLV